MASGSPLTPSSGTVLPRTKSKRRLSHWFSKIKNAFRTSRKGNLSDGEEAFSTKSSKSTKGRKLTDLKIDDFNTGKTDIKKRKHPLKGILRAPRGFKKNKDKSSTLEAETLITVEPRRSTDGEAIAKVAGTYAAQEAVWVDLDDRSSKSFVRSSPDKLHNDSIVPTAQEVLLTILARQPQPDADTETEDDVPPTFVPRRGCAYQEWSSRSEHPRRRSRRHLEGIDEDDAECARCTPRGKGLFTFIRTGSMYSFRRRRHSHRQSSRESSRESSNWDKRGRKEEAAFRESKVILQALTPQGQDGEKPSRRPSRSHSHHALGERVRREDKDLYHSARSGRAKDGRVPASGRNRDRERDEDGGSIRSRRSEPVSERSSIDGLVRMAYGATERPSFNRPGSALASERASEPSRRGFSSVYES